VATNFPSTADTSAIVGGDSKPAPGTELSDSTKLHPTHSDLHENVGDAVLAIEAKLGHGGSPTPAANTVLTGTVSGESAWATVDTAMITADAVTGAKIADDTIDSEHYAAGSIDTEHIADDQVTQAKIAAGAVDTTELAADAVNGDKIANDAIAAEHLATDSVTADAIAAGAVDTAELADDAVTADKLADNAVGNDQLIDAPTFTGITLGGQDLGEIETFSPNWTNLSGTFQSVGAYYAYIKDMVYVSIEAELSASTGIGDLRVDLPVAGADTHQAANGMLQVQLFDYDTTKYYQGMTTPVDSNTVQIRYNIVDGSTIFGQPIGSSAPFTWGDGDKILITGFYRVGS